MQEQRTINETIIPIIIIIIIVHIHAMKVFRKGRGVVLLVPNLGARWCCMVNFTP
jgi:hypothetical protein